MRERSPFGRLLKQARARLDVTQDMVADRVGCATQTVRSFENGKRRPSREMAQRLADVLDIAPEDRAEFLMLARTSGRVDEDTTPRTATAALPTLQIAEQMDKPMPVPIRPRPMPAPIPLNVLIGREQEYHSIKAALLNPNQRLVTLLGQGGTGKTRLAQQLARDLHEQVPDGVAWVPLASVARAEDVPRTLADALGLVVKGPASPAEQLLVFLRDHETVLVLDNLEHLLDAASFISILLHQAPRITILATSRERLRITGEQVVELAGLALPDAAQPERAARSAAVLLFVERARQVSHHFALTPSNRAAIVRICEVLQGLPLGIELAATWIRTLGVEEIADELARSLDLLDVAERTAAERHQSLRAVFEHSWRLLDAQEQRVLAQLAVFQGGFDRAAAQAIAGASLPVLASLHDKSLVRRNADQRYDLHPLVQQYAGAKLDDARATHDRHGTYYADRVEAALPSLIGPQQRSALALLTAELPNIRAAWGWVVGKRDLRDIERMAETLLRHFEIRDGFQEGDRLFSEAIVALGIPSPQDNDVSRDEKRTVGRLLVYAAACQPRIGAMETLDPRRLTEGIALLEAIDDRWGLTSAHQTQGIITYIQGRYEVAKQHCVTALDYAEQSGHVWYIGCTEFFYGLIEETQEVFAEAVTWYRRALRSFRRLGNPFLLQTALVYLAAALSALGEYDEATRYIDEWAITSDDPWAWGMMLRHRGKIALVQGDAAGAVRVLEQSQEVFRHNSNRWEWMRTLSVLGEAYTAAGDTAQARKCYREVLAMSGASNFITIVLGALQGLAHLVRDDQPDQARAWADYVARHPASGTHIRRAAIALLQALGEDVDEQTLPDQTELPPIEDVARAAM